MSDRDPILSYLTAQPVVPKEQAVARAVDWAAILFLVVVLILALLFGVLAIVLFAVGFPK